MKMKMSWVGLLLLFPAVVVAQEFARTAEEHAMCSAAITQGRDTSDQTNWVHMHHYCDCLRFTQRAVNSPNEADKRDNLGQAIQGCDYVLGHVSENFYMRPMVLVSKGRALEIAKRPAEAIQAYETAIKLNPSYYKAYIGLSDAYLAIGDRKSALQAVESGLQIAPQSTGLQKRLSKLKGS